MIKQIVCAPVFFRWTVFFVFLLFGKNGAGNPISVELSPCGTVCFPSVPTKAILQDANYCDMLIVCGFTGQVWAAQHALPQQNIILSRIPSFSPRFTAVPRLLPQNGAVGFSYDKELFYAFAPDVIHIDPVQLSSAKGWNARKVKEIAREVAPFFANRFSRDNRAPVGAEGYVFYSIPELGEKMGQAYRETARVNKVLRLLQRTEESVSARLREKSPASPRVALLYFNGIGSMTPFSLYAGNGQAQYRILRAKDAFYGTRISTYGSGGGTGIPIDLETLLTVNPDVILMPFAGASGLGDRTRFGFKKLSALATHPVAKNIAAFRNGRVYPGGTPLQGPLTYLFQLEMAAKQLYPKVFGSWREDGSYPPDECLFNREEVRACLE